MQLDRWRWAFIVSALLAPGAALAQQVLPIPETPAAAYTGRTPEESAPAQWPRGPVAPKGAPNILLILTDDVGFGASSAFGGPIPTPTLETLAKAGLRYTAFHTTAMCSPTRAALLTGRNHHDVGSGRVTEAAFAYDGYTTIIPRSAATVAEILKGNGYATAAFGKWHNTPDWEASPAGPFDHWPTHMGFQHFFGFQGGDTNQYAPALFQDTVAVDPPRGDPSYHLERDLADRAIAWVRQQKAITPDRPFFIHYATGAAHAPHSAPKEWMERFRGRFDQGWDKLREETLARQKAQGIVPADTALTPRPDIVPAWDTLSADQKQVYARLMEAYAAMLAYSDQEIGRVIEALREMGELDNTLVVFIEGDNGATAEGGPDGRLNEGTFMNGMLERASDIKARLDDIGGPDAYNLYPAGWALAMNTPFPWFKQIASHLGGTRNGMVMSWPARIKDKGTVRAQFHHVVDITPTLLDVAGIQAPTTVNGVPQKPMAGVSMAYSFADAKAASTHRTQYFELFGNLGLYHDGWLASTTPFQMPWAVSPVGKTLDEIPWQLFDLSRDFSQSVDLAAQNPAKLRELKDMFWIEAARNQVLPIVLGKGRAGPPKPSLADGRTRFVYWPGTQRITGSAAPSVSGRSFDIEVDAEVPADGGNGMLFTQGGRFGGYGLYLQQGRLVFHYSLLDLAHSAVISPAAVPAGRHRLGMAFRYDGGGPGKGGVVTLLVDGRPVAEGRLERTAPFTQGYGETLDVGTDTGTAVSRDYEVPFAFNGTVRKATLTLK